MVLYCTRARFHSHVLPSQDMKCAGIKSEFLRSVWDCPPGSGPLASGPVKQEPTSLYGRDLWPERADAMNGLEGQGGPVAPSKPLLQLMGVEGPGPSQQLERSAFSSLLGLAMPSTPREVINANPVGTRRALSAEDLNHSGALLGRAEDRLSPTGRSPHPVPPLLPANTLHGVNKYTEASLAGHEDAFSDSQKGAMTSLPLDKRSPAHRKAPAGKRFSTWFAERTERFKSMG